MILVYAGCGAMLLVANIQGVPSMTRKMFGGVLLLYAGYRGFKLYRNYRINDDEN